MSARNQAVTIMRKVLKSEFDDSAKFNAKIANKIRL